MVAVPLAVRRLVYERDGHACARCGRTGDESGRCSLHHRRARGAGGDKLGRSARPSNLLVLCGSGTTGCHGWVESHRAEAEAHGWLLRHTIADPADVPVLWRGRRSLLLDTGEVVAA